MNIVFYPRFERGYKRLDPQIPRIAHERIALFEQDPFDRRLRTHELHGTQTVDDAPGRHQQLGLLVEIIVECCSCGPALTMGGRICASMVAAGPRPALGEVIAASCLRRDRGHGVSILVATTGPVGRCRAPRPYEDGAGWS